MGRPFLEEISRALDTLQWAKDISCENLRGFPVDVREPLICVGSGGSQSAAVLATLLHRQLGRSAYPSTPLDLIEFCRTSVPGQVLFLSASGKNKDIIASCQASIRAEARHLHALCLRRESPLVDCIRSFSRGSATELDLLGGKDGFLATNSLVASFAILARQYRALCPTIFPDISDFHPVRGDLVDEFKDFAARSEWLVLYGGWGWPAAQDLESKMSEAALRTVQLTDLRNFGHGRHHWLAKREESSGVIFLVDHRYVPLAQRTITALPKNVPCAVMASPFADVRASIELLLKVFDLTWFVGHMSGIDPGRPGVPDFGSRLYHLPIPKELVPSSSMAKPAIVSAASARKQGSPPSEMQGLDTSNAAKALQTLAKAKISGIVLDYDGTLVDPRERYSSIRDSVSKALARIMNFGYPIGIATGRGKSVREHLRTALPESAWSQVIVGYYNGGQLLNLSSEEMPRTSPPESPLDEFLKVISADALLSTLAIFEGRPRQITVSPTERVNWSVARRRLYELLAIHRFDGIKIFESTHSIDVLPVFVSKVDVVSSTQGLAETLGKSGAPLRIGDCGAWPGNDCELLADPLGLSVDLVSTSSEGCWNLLPAGVAGVLGTLFYLDRLHPSGNCLRLKL